LVGTEEILQKNGCTGMSSAKIKRAKNGVHYVLFSKNGTYVRWEIMSFTVEDFLQRNLKCACDKSVSLYLVLFFL
jgi:hypothetical protein